MTLHRPFVATILLLIVALEAAADGSLPAALVQVPESTKTIYVAETSAAAIHRFDRTDSGLKRMGSYYMSIGELGDGKQASGDKRTPLGIYFVTEQLDTSKLHEKYGVTAFPLDYPNEWDRLAERTGDGIWVHGVQPGEGKRPPLDTDGCIALGNDDLSALMPTFSPNSTPVLVTREVQWVDENGRARVAAELEERVAAWVASKTSVDTYSYLSLYDEEFSRWGLNRSEWAVLALENRFQQADEAAYDELLLLAYPEEEALYLSRFRLTGVRDGEPFSTTTRLYWRRDDAGVLRIVAENVG